jgi:uncharacterized protein YkwD
MMRADRDHVRDCARAGVIGHKGHDGSLHHERLVRWGFCPGFSSENLAYGKE